MVQRAKSEKANYRWPHTNPYILLITFYIHDVFNAFQFPCLDLYIWRCHWHILFQKIPVLTTVLMCSNTQPTFHTHLNDLEVHLWRYLFNGHTASHACLTQLQGIEVECIVHVCCICNKCSVCFVLAKLNTRLQSA